MALILQTLSPDRRMGALANGQQVVKSFRYYLTDPRQFDIMQSGPCLGGPNAIRSIEATGVHHAARRRRGVAARGARAAGRACATHRRAHEHNCGMIRKSSPALRYSCKYSLSSRESDLPDPCQPTAYRCPKAEDGNRRKSVVTRVRQRSG